MNDLTTNNLTTNNLTTNNLAKNSPTTDNLTTSAGTHAFPGQPMCAEAAAAIGIDPNGHRSREMTKTLLDAAAMILPVDSQTRAQAARMSPACRTRMFTLRQAAVLAAEISFGLERGALPAGAAPMPDAQGERLQWLVTEMDATRGVRPGRPDEEDIQDRHGGPDHQQAIDEVVQEATKLGLAMAIVLAIDRPAG